MEFLGEVAWDELLDTERDRSGVLTLAAGVEFRIGGAGAGGSGGGSGALPPGTSRKCAPAVLWLVLLVSLQNRT